MQVGIFQSFGSCSPCSFLLLLSQFSSLHYSLLLLALLMCQKNLLPFNTSLTFYYSISSCVSRNETQCCKNVYLFFALPPFFFSFSLTLLSRISFIWKLFFYFFYYSPYIYHYFCLYTYCYSLTTIIMFCPHEFCFLFQYPSSHCKDYLYWNITTDLLII